MLWIEFKEWRAILEVLLAWLLFLIGIEGGRGQRAFPEILHYIPRPPEGVQNVVNEATDFTYGE